MRVQEKYNAKLLVEGNDDQHVIFALCQKFALSENFDVIDCEGVENLYEQIPVRFKQPGVSKVGMIVDADTDLEKRWEALRAILELQGFNLPAAIPAEGLVVSNKDGITVGVWIMPDNNLNGMLEDFISFLVPHDDKLLPVVHSTLETVEAQKLNKYPVHHKSKAAIHSWLSLQEDPGTPLGLAFTKRYLTTDQERCQKLIAWLKALFG